MKYSINLVRTLRIQEAAGAKTRFRLLALSLSCFSALVLALFYCTLQTFTMMRTVDTERQNLRRIEAEYHKYKETKMTVDKADIELLNSIQSRRIYWTKKLASMAFHLPENYWITKFGYEQQAFKVQGYGYISMEQEQLITLDDYLNSLRVDSTYNDAFPVTYLNSTARTDEQSRERVSFEFASMSGRANP